MSSFNSRSLFTRFAQWTARAAGRPVTFSFALVIILVWAVSGPMFGFSDTWQLVINTGTTIVTFLMVFLIQNTQYRDSEAIHIKLDELIFVSDKARNALLNLEELEDAELEKLRQHYLSLAEQAREAMRDSRRPRSR